MVLTVIAVAQRGDDLACSTLLAILLNPPLTTSGARTIRAVELARRVLGYSHVEIVNLHGGPTATVVELNMAVDQTGWIDARADIRRALGGAGGLLGGWGIAGLTGMARRARNEQVDWLKAEAGLAGLTQIWTVGGEPRHPSRWHQFVSDKYGRTAGGCFEDRLAQVLVAAPIALASDRRPPARTGGSPQPQSAGFSP